MNYLVYKTINNISGKYYFGRHITNNINDSYLGSGFLIKRLLKKDPNPKHYTKEIIKNCDSPEEMIDLERRLLLEKLDKDPKCINLIIGNAGTIGVIKHSERNKEKMSRNHADVSGKNNPRYGAVLSPETKEKMGLKNKGIPLSILHKKGCKCSFCHNIPVSIKTRKKMSISAKKADNSGRFKKGHTPHNKKMYKIC